MRCCARQVKNQWTAMLEGTKLCEQQVTALMKPLTGPAAANSLLLQMNSIAQYATSGA
jgi:hypothetical protein